ncbi:hypothetical protein CRV01_04315 [Arcobacter sp. CECT 8983]|uniref:DUF6161 domain-containing protein n=1 Tax=Arcobacter sp. CECT 8983 TaxID=2044508 RepID=UPI00100B5D4D|nr:DUF6161 domain-containing protein [Arcobacter sp. CECT 8983]RXJ90389.1 hypothetical protein CRV01_04315 [Arcobacter sp. CECT 8983]
MDITKLVNEVFAKSLNSIIVEEIKNFSKEDYYIENFRKSILYLKLRINTQADETKVFINDKLEDFLRYTSSKALINNYKIELIDIMNYFINLLEENEKISISKEEFSNRYDKLISMMNRDVNKSNLSLYTKENKKFRIFRKNTSIVIRPESDNNNLTSSKENLIKIAYGEKENNLKAYTTIIIEKIFDNSIFDEIEGASNVFVDQLTNMDEKNQRINKLEEDKDKLYGEIKQLEDKLNENEELFKDVKSMYEKSSSLVDEYENAKETVLSELKVHKSTKFWEQQIAFYTKRYWIYIGIVIVLISFLLYGIFYVDKQFVSEMNSVSQEKVEKDIESKKDKKTDHSLIIKSADLIKYGFIILFISLNVWIIRIVMKIALSNYHLSIDAKERVTMINTYLALMKEGNTLEENDKRIMIESIFRQTNHGIIKDESSITVTDIISSIKK